MRVNRRHERCPKKLLGESEDDRIADVVLRTDRCAIQLQEEQVGRLKHESEGAAKVP